jgi:hypothetical protein
MGIDTRWADARRIEAWAGEVRVNLVRLVAIVAFYGHHLVNLYLYRDDPVFTGPYHAGVTALVLAWALAVVVLYLGLSRRWLPAWLPYAVVAWDVLLITALLLLTGDPRTWLPVLYLLVVASSALRLSLPLVATATVGSMAAYLVFLGHVRFVLQLPPEQRLSRPNQIIFLLALATAGLVAGQAVRQARRLVQGYPVTVEEPPPAPAAAAPQT